MNKTLKVFLIILVIIATFLIVGSLSYNFFFRTDTKDIYQEVLDKAETIDNPQTEIDALGEGQ